MSFSAEPLDSDESAGKPGALVSPVVRAFRLLRYVVDGGSTSNLSEVGRSIDVNRVTVMRLIATLEHEGVLEALPQGGHRIGLPFLKLATAATDPPPVPGDETRWLHEIKFDGYRTIAHIDRGSVKLITRGGLDWTHRFGDLPGAFSTLPCTSAVIDGEIVVPDSKGISSFAALQDALAEGAGNKLIFYAFDLVYLDGWDLTAAALGDRKRLLAQLLAGSVSAKSAIQYSDHIEGDGQPLYDHASEIGLEGIVSKRISAPYTSGRSKTWTKAKALTAGASGFRSNIGD